LAPLDPQRIRPGEIFRALAVFVEPPSAEHASVAATLRLGELPPLAEHTDLFDFQFFPFASVYLGPEGMRGGEARDRVAGFWRALELEPPRDPDHLTVLLAAYGALLDKAEVATAAEADQWRHVCQVFLHEHLLSWLPLFLARLESHAAGFYGAWARQLRRVLTAEPLDERLAVTLAAALRDAEPLPDPRAEGGEPFLSALLAPVRTGFILTRDDLAGMAGELGLGRRIGERRYVLRNLLSQDATAVLRALARLAREAGSAAERSRMPPSTLDWWRGRARASAKLLESLAAEAKELNLLGDSVEN
jgi:hypothetical protein